LPSWNSVVFSYRRVPNDAIEMESTDTNSTELSLDSDTKMTTTSHPPYRLISKFIYLFHYGGSVLIRLLIANALHQFANGSFLVVLVLYLSLQVPRGGVGLEPRGVGIVYAYFGFIGLVFQLLWFRRCVRKMGLRHTYQLGTLLLAVGSFTVLCSHLVARNRNIDRFLFWPLLLGFVSPQGIGFMCGLPVMGTLLANASPPDIQG